MYFNGNYSSTFIFWDRWCGTDSEYRQWQSKHNVLAAVESMNAKELETYGKVIEPLAAKDSAKDARGAGAKTAEDPKEVYFVIISWELFV